MGTLIRNPIVYTFAATGVTLLLLSVLIGVRLPQTLQLIFVPYTYDITYGVGATGSIVYSVTLGIAQVGLIALTTLGAKLENALARRVVWSRRAVWSIGVILVVVYFLIVVLGYLINNFH